MSAEHANQRAKITNYIPIFNRYIASVICTIICFVSRSSAFLSSPSLRRPIAERSYQVMASHNQKPDTASIKRSPRKRAASKQDVETSQAAKRSSSTPIKSTQQCAAPPTESPTDDAQLLLQSWLQHNHHSYHLSFLSPTRSYAIRSSLVKWYRANRRKLPWRGDVGPYNGSTAGFSEKKNKITKKSNGGDIRSFFGPTAGSKNVSSLGEKKDDDNDLRSSKKSDNITEKREVSAYGVWVSEIMLQQTRVEAVIPYYLKWMERFPTVQSLANASPEEVNSHWAGLGFYRRARLLHQGAKRVVEEYGGVVPDTVEELMKVEGIGRYTASAVASIAYGVEVPVVDGNVCRVLSRLTGVANHIKAGVFKDDLGWILAERIVQARSSEDCNESHELIGSPGEVNQALMELGATYCSPSGSGIDDQDPLKQFYMSTRLGSAIGQSMKSKRNLAIQPPIGIDTDDDRCRLCDVDGVSTVFFDISDRIREDSIKATTKNDDESFAISGHAAMPMAPPKKAKREEVLAVAAICLEEAGSADVCWLMIRRPSDGLLANQWEFPSICVWDSSKLEAKKNTKKSSSKASEVQVPQIDAAVRSAELDQFLHSILQSTNGAKELVLRTEKRLQVKDPIVHVFSHVCHTMYVEKCRIKCGKLKQKRWKTQDGREAGWFNGEDLQACGVTSGVRKVIAVSETT